MDMGIDERHSGLTSCQSQRPVLVFIPVNGIVTQNFKLQSFTFNQCSVLKEIAFNKLFSLKYLKLILGDLWRLPSEATGQ
jgi:hypothetical protein